MKRHDINIVCSQVADYPQFKNSTATKFVNVDQHLKKVSKESLMLYSTKTVKVENVLDIFVFTELN
jgi:hypothetical protein